MFLCSYVAHVTALEYIFLLFCALNCLILCSYVNYIEQSLNTFFKKCIFGSVLSDVNYEYLLIMWCKIIDRLGFGMGGIFENFKNFFKNIFFQKSVLFSDLDVVYWCLLWI